MRRAARGAERDELLASLEELACWYRDLVAVGGGAETAVVHFDRLEELARTRRSSGSRAPSARPSSCARRGAASRSSTSHPPLALEALFVQLRRAFAGSITVAA